MTTVLATLIKDKGLENNVEFVQQLALLKYLSDNEASSDGALKFITAARVGNEMYQRVTGKRRVEECRQQFLAGVIRYIQQNPRASSAAIRAEIEKLLGIFILQIKTKKTLF